ncbi:hypothetical protein SE16_00760 [Ardenticatena maritima]|uniref:TNase-like domain-containing protein n=1 Tax=Ardenticatena maritima TaxID=872965 RepID=A0A0P6YD13_9CHLR|nr:hypothetical protein SE16_00760 [Ardenticatena maritima]
MVASTGVSCLAGRPAQSAQLVGVVDGDTIDVLLDGRVVRVRYIGVDTPERGDALYAAATEANRRLLGNGALLLVRDVSETDRYGRLLRYVVAGDTFVNAELVRQGYAQVLTVPPDVACADWFVALQREAIAAGRGLWATPPTPVPPPTPIPPAPPPPPPANQCDPSYPDVCIPPPPPDLDCGDIPYRRFRVLPPDPHRFDGDHDGIGCER